MLRKIAAVALNGVAPFELSVLCEVFGLDRSAQGLPKYEFAVCAAEPGPLMTEVGFRIDTPYDLSWAEDADLVAVPAAPWNRELPQELLDLLRRTVDRGARVMSVCSGAFILAAAGLLDGRRCTTHWMYVDKLARMYPDAKVDPDVLYVDEGSVLTSAGTAAGIDLCLHIVRQEQGVAVANAIARRMVVPPHRDGGQAQYVETPVQLPDRADGLADLLAWMAGNLDVDMTVDSLADRAHMSPRTFARRFRAETGTTPHRWLTGQRVALAQRLLEETDEPVESIAVRSGFGNAATMRNHFAQWVRTTPQAYRRCFRSDDACAVEEAAS